MGFDQFFNRDGGKVARYEELTKSATEEEKRDFEMQLLVPQALPDYGGPVATADVIESLTVRLVFADDEDLHLFSKYFKVSQYVEKSVNDLNLLISVLQMLEEGSLTYDSKTGQLTVVNGTAPAPLQPQRRRR